MDGEPDCRVYACLCIHRTRDDGDDGDGDARVAFWYEQIETREGIPVRLGPDGMHASLNAVEVCVVGGPGGGD